MIRTISATEARVHFGEVLRRVIEHDETVVVERAGRQGVVILSQAAFDRLASRSRHVSVQSLLQRASALRDRVNREWAGRPVPSVEEMIQRSREERDGELTDLR